MLSPTTLRRVLLDRWLFDVRQRGVDRLPRPQLEALQERRLRALLRYAAEHSPFYAQLYRGTDVTRAPPAELPTVDKPTLMEHWDEVVTDRRLRRQEAEAFVSDAANLGRYFRGRYQIALSSGSTGTRGLFVFGGADGPWRGFASRRAARMQRHRPTRRRAEVIPHSPGTVAYRFRRTIEPIDPWSRSFDSLLPTDRLVDALNRYQPDSLTGYARHLEILAGEQLAGRLRIPPHTVFSKGEALTPEIRAIAERAWRAPVRQTYGTTEAGSVAAQCTAGEFMHVFEDLLVLETAPQGDGTQEGEGAVLVTNLMARTFPLIRYRLGDRAELTDEPCPCGRTFRRLRRVSGRDYEPLWFQRPDGSWTSLHWNAFEVPIRRRPEIHRFQLRHEPGGMTLFVLPAPGARVDPAELERELRGLLVAQGVVPPAITVLTVDEVELRRRSAGKYVSFVTLVEPPDASRGWTG